MQRANWSKAKADCLERDTLLVNADVTCVQTKANAVCEEYVWTVLPNARCPEQFFSATFVFSSCRYVTLFTISASDEDVKQEDSNVITHLSKLF
jgi:hypothetical protein